MPITWLDVCDEKTCTSVNMLCEATVMVLADDTFI